MLVLLVNEICKPGYFCFTDFVICCLYILRSIIYPDVKDICFIFYL